MRDDNNTTAKCPFYRKDGPCSICCDGVHHAKRTGLFFENTQKKTEHVQQFCNDKWEDCQIAWILDV